MIVCIAEKPSVAKDIAAVLGATQTKDGYIEGNGYQVTWTFGHLCELKEPHEYTPNWKSWNLGSLPMIPARFGIKLKADKGIEKQFKTIESLMQKADGIINCGDAGQEGELIQRWVMLKAGAKCPVKRLWISSLTEEAIREGFQHLKDQSEYQSLYEAGLSRAIGDWTLGMNATRLYTLKYGQNRQVLSIGRVQTPTLALIVKRQLEIEDFHPEPYWVLTTQYRNTLFTSVVRIDPRDAEDYDETKKTQPKEVVVYQKFLKHEEAEAAYNSVLNVPFTVTSVGKKKGTEAPPRLYDLTSLQVECNKKFGFSADQTLQLIQSLYEKKFTTYPRVDTTFLSDDIYPKCPQILKGVQQSNINSQAVYANLVTPLIGKSLPKSKKVFDSSKVTDHHAIIPTGVPTRNLTDMEAKVYDQVARRFIAVFYPDCQFSTTTVMGKAAEVEFKATGKQILDPGWKVVFAKDIPSDDEPSDEEKVLPEFVKGEEGPHIPNLAEKWTTPPKPYTEATLLRAMETAGKLVDNDELRDAMKENGIGRPSTRAAIIETLFKRHYIRKERKNLVATPTGVELIGLIREELLKSAELTGIWEKKLREIENKRYDAKQFIDELKKMVSDIVHAVLSDNSNRRVAIAEEPQKKKPAPKEKRTPTRKTSKASAAKETPAASPSPVAATTPAASTPAASTSTAAPTAPAPPAVTAPSIEGQPCPLCGKGHIIKGRTAYGCSEWKNGCTYRKPFSEL
jgi:DNA topoisomerase-3